MSIIRRKGRRRKALENTWMSIMQSVKTSETTCPMICIIWWRCTSRFLKYRYCLISKKLKALKKINCLKFVR
jgi:hypothetical protein